MVGHVVTTELQSVSNRRRKVSIMKKKILAVGIHLPARSLLGGCGWLYGPTNPRMERSGTVLPSPVAIRTERETGSKRPLWGETIVLLVRSSYGSRYTR
jgi:hypothetical protein